MIQSVTPRFMDDSVSPVDVAAHLRVYGSIRAYLFSLPRGYVYYDENDILCATAVGKLYLRRTVRRFRIWIEKILRPKYEKYGANHEGLQDEELPPYDVVCVLQSFMLHPRAFYADTLRLYPEFGVLEGFPLAQVAALIDDNMQYIPTTEQVAFWEKATGEPFATPFETSPDETFSITCPSCKHSFEANWFKSSDDGQGSNPAAHCESCDLVITELSYGAASIIQDILRAKSGGGVGLAGTLYTTEGFLDPEGSRALTIEISKAVGLYDIETLSVKDVTVVLMGVPDDVLDNLSVDFLSYYGLPEGFSFDLGAAVLRQTGFASKMYHNGWTHPQFPHDCPELLQEAISRYAGFLTLSMDRSAGSLGPAHDIDLVWHTHQLKANYRNDFLRIFGWFLDHVDFAPIDTLATSYANGGDRWETTFGTPYYEHFLNARYPQAISS